METYKAQNGAPGPLQTAEPSTRQSLAGRQSFEAAFAATQGQYQDEETRLEYQAATEWAQEEVLEDVLKDALEQAHFQEQEAEEAASGSAEKRYQHSFARPAERDLGRSSARPFARPSAWPSASPSGNRSGNPSASPLGHPSGNRSASPSGRPSVPLYESSRVRSADDSGEETEALGAAVYEDRLSRSLTDRLADRQDSTAAGYQEDGLRSPEERAWKRRPASSEAVYFYGKAHIAYIPDGKVVGLSKLARTVEVFARRPQIQEQSFLLVARFLPCAPRSSRLSYTRQASWRSRHCHPC